MVRYKPKLWWWFLWFESVICKLANPQFNAPLLNIGASIVSRRLVKQCLTQTYCNTSNSHLMLYYIKPSTKWNIGNAGWNFYLIWYVQRGLALPEPSISREPRLLSSLHVTYTILDTGQSSPPWWPTYLGNLVCPCLSQSQYWQRVRGW